MFSTRKKFLAETVARTVAPIFDYAVQLVGEGRHELWTRPFVVGFLFGEIHTLTAVSAPILRIQLRESHVPKLSIQAISKLVELVEYRGEHDAHTFAIGIYNLADQMVSDRDIEFLDGFEAGKIVAKISATDTDEFDADANVKKAKRLLSSGNITKKYPQSDLVPDRAWAMHDVFFFKRIKSALGKSKKR
jgi:hypothetical protein